MVTLAASDDGSDPYRWTPPAAVRDRLLAYLAAAYAAPRLPNGTIDVEQTVTVYVDPLR